MSEPAINPESTGDEYGKENLQLWLRLFACTRLIEKYIRQNLRRENGMTLAQFDYMAQLYRTPQQGLTMRELSQRLMVTNGNITGMTDRLQGHGLVRRQAYENDRRVSHIFLTKKGWAVFTAIAHKHEQWINEIFSGLETNDSLHLVELLAKTKSKAQTLLKSPQQ